LSQWNPGAAKNYRIASFAIERINSFIKVLDSNFSKDQIKSVAPLIKELKNIEGFIKKQDTVTKKGDKYMGSIPLSVTYMIDG
jgi:hypothetical protein